MSKHTPGPWVAQGRDSLEVMSPGGAVVTVGKGTSRADYLEAQADARLIAAAPELLEALKQIVYRVEKGTFASGCTAVDDARAAIAKAEGTR